MISMTGHCFDWKKWIHYFDDVTSIILCVALSKYDQVQYGQVRHLLLMLHAAVLTVPTIEWC